MGKGEIIENLGEGQYKIKVLKKVTNIQNQIIVIQEQVEAVHKQIYRLQVEMRDNPDIDNNDLIANLRLQITSLELSEAELQKIVDESEPEMQAWCADFTMDLSGEVGLIVVARETEKGINIRPGFDDAAAWDGVRDGQIAPAREVGPWTFGFNYGAEPAMQTHKAIYRYATITYIDGDLCTVQLDQVRSEHQNFLVNSLNKSAQSQTLIETIENVEIDYMDCNGAAFAVDDRVILELTGTDTKKSNWELSTKKVIGFISEPKSCAEFVIAVGWCDGSYQNGVHYRYCTIDKTTGIVTWIDESMVSNYNTELSRDIVTWMNSQQDWVTPDLNCSGNYYTPTPYGRSAAVPVVDVPGTQKTAAYYTMENGKAFYLELGSNTITLYTGQDTKQLCRFNYGYYKYTIPVTRYWRTVRVAGTTSDWDSTTSCGGDIIPVAWPSCAAVCDGFVWNDDYTEKYCICPFTYSGSVYQSWYEGETPPALPTPTATVIDTCFTLRCILAPCNYDLVCDDEDPPNCWFVLLDEDPCWTVNERDVVDWLGINEYPGTGLPTVDITNSGSIIATNCEYEEYLEDGYPTEVKVWTKDRTEVFGTLLEDWGKVASLGPRKYVRQAEEAGHPKFTKIVLRTTEEYTEIRAEVHAEYLYKYDEWGLPQEKQTFIARINNTTQMISNASFEQGSLTVVDGDVVIFSDGGADSTEGTVPDIIDVSNPTDPFYTAIRAKHNEVIADEGLYYSFNETYVGYTRLVRK